MKFTKKALFTMLAASLSFGSAKAQLSSNPDKFLGNITTRYQMDYSGYTYSKYWNQLTCENESKWGSCEGTNGSYSWPTTQSNYCKNNNILFKWHALIWGAQHPNWFNSSMTPEQRYKEIVQWFDALKKQYPNLEVIDVANECISGHQADTYLFTEALGGGGDSGWDWLVKAFELAYERWPNAILIYNDFNTFQWNTDQFIELCQSLRDAGAPIDAYGCQSHDLTDCSLSTFKASNTKIQNALKMPMYITEYDIGTSDDAYQKQRYSEQIPVMWEADYCAGITIWGWHYGCTWTTDGNSGLIRNKQERPALTWLREYMQTDKAKNAKSPYPGMKKEASVYIKPSARNIEKDKASDIIIRAKMRTKTIEKVELYVANKLVATVTEGTNGQYVAQYTPTETGDKELKAVVTCTDGYTWTRYGKVTVCNARAPYKNTIQELPGTLQLENFDTGGDGIAFHDMNSNRQSDAASYRTDTGIDIGNGNGGKIIGYTEVGEWMEYTVNVKEAGIYSYDISYATPQKDACISLSLSDGKGNLTALTEEKLLLPQTNSSAWTTYKVAHGRLLLPLEEGQQIIRLSITGCSSQYAVNLDKIVFKRVDLNDDIKLAIVSDAKKVAVSTKVNCTAEIEAPEGTEIANVTYYVNGVKNKTLTEAPYAWTYTPTVKGNVRVSAIATDAEGKQSSIEGFDLTVTAKRSPYKTGANKAPGIIEAENFDKGEEGLTWHDTSSEPNETRSYRSDCGGVDIVSGNGGYAIGWTASGEWLEYTIEVANPGLYTIEMTASNGTSTSASVSFSRVGDDDKLTTLWTITRAGTGSWSTYKTSKSSTKKELEAGKQVIRVTFKNGNINLDNFELKLVEDYTPVPDIMATDAIQARPVGIYNLSGQKVDANYRGIVIKNGKKVLQK